MENENNNPSLSEEAKEAFLNSLTEENRAFASQKGYGSANDLVAGLKAAAKFDGLDIDKMVSLPTDKSTPEEINAFYAKLGRPESAEKYNFNIKEGESDEFAKQIAPALFAAGISQKQLEVLLPKWNEIVSQTQAAQAKAQEEEFKTAMATLQQEWGKDYSANETLAKRASAAIGLSAEEIDSLVKAKGTAWVFRTMAKIGKGIGEQGFKGLDSQVQINLSDPREAEAKLNRLIGDPNFAAKFAAGDSEAVKTWETLTKAAYGGK